MNKVIKLDLKMFVFIIIGAVLLSSITGAFAYSLTANNIGYTPKDSSWNVANTKEAIDELRIKAGELSTNYSTNEKKVGRWIDGKSIYQKTITFSDYGGLSRHWVSIGDIPNVSEIIKVQGKFVSWEIGGFWGSSTTDYCSVTSSINSSGVGHISMVRSGLEDGTGFVTVQYTKTTD